MTTTNNAITVMALYKFTTFADFVSWQEPIKKTMLANGVKGTLLIAHEGINGTIAGSASGIDAVKNFLNNIPALGEFSYKCSYADHEPFYRTKVKLKKEIVTMGITDLDPSKDAGIYVKPHDWNALISDPNVVLIDTRNEYEYAIGTFKGAINPHTNNFREFPQFVKKHLDPTKHKKVAMFCTGGIRCEKSTAYLKQQGFDEVYHLQGGILQYFAEVKTKDSLWEGECFVFDNRVAVNQELEKGSYDQCYACRMPITEEDKNHPHYIKGQSCHHCFTTTTDAQKERFKEREKQTNLAKERGKHHIGGEVFGEIMTARHQKQLRKQAQSNHHTP